MRLAIFFVEFQWSHRHIFFSAIVLLAVSIFFSHRVVSEFRFFPRLRKSRSPDWFVWLVFTIDVRKSLSLNASHWHLKHVEVSVWQLQNPHMSRACKENHQLRLLVKSRIYHLPLLFGRRESKTGIKELQVDHPISANSAYFCQLCVLNFKVVESWPQVKDE